LKKGALAYMWGSKKKRKKKVSDFRDFEKKIDRLIVFDLLQMTFPR
jgi:hypothetical protein